MRGCWSSPSQLCAKVGSRSSFRRRCLQTTEVSRWGRRRSPARCCGWGCSNPAREGGGLDAAAPSYRPRMSILQMPELSAPGVLLLQVLQKGIDLLVAFEGGEAVFEGIAGDQFARGHIASFCGI